MGSKFKLNTFPAPKVAGVLCESIKIVSYNMHGFQSGSSTVSSFCQDGESNMDVIMVQENWLGPANLFKINNFPKDYVGYGISALEEALKISVLKGRPYGGVCTLVKSSLVHLMKYNRCLQRMVIVALGDYLLINCYFRR